MNIKELAEQAGFGYMPNLNSWLGTETELERFAELIRDDERNKCAQDYLQDCADAIDAARQDEREACAKLCEEHERPNLYGVKECAKAIRQRGEK